MSLFIKVTDRSDQINYPMISNIIFVKSVRNNTNYRAELHFQNGEVLYTKETAEEIVKNCDETVGNFGCSCST